MAVATTHRLHEQELLAAARDGDENAFARIIESHRAELHAHCYRMLGSLHDAEDALQEALLHAWRGLPQFAGRSSLRTWLHRIATNTCLDAIAQRPKRILPIDHGPPAGRTSDLGAPLVESVWVEPYPDEALGLPEGYAAPDARYEQREAVELAFVAALQHLPPKQRAVLILREVLGYSAQEVSETLDTSPASVNSALQRARKSLADRLPERSQQETMRSLGDERVRELVEAYVDAWMRADVNVLRTLLAEDAVFSMPPWAIWWRGRDAIVDLAIAGLDTCPETRVLFTHANGQPALACYAKDPETGRYVAAAIDVLTFDGASIADITGFVTPRLFSSWGLPNELAG
jgi:RNA polymerase sigma-70 factor, ECF subfamily